MDTHSGTFGFRTVSTILRYHAETVAGWSFGPGPKGREALFFFCLVCLKNKNTTQEEKTADTV